MIPISDLADKNIAVINEFCTDMFHTKRTIFTDDFQVTESTTHYDLPANDEYVFPYFVVRDDLIKLINEILTTTADCSAILNFQISTMKVIKQLLQ